MAAVDLFAGTAGYYARYRPRYPQAMFESWAAAFGLDGRGRLLDLGCGTGQVALPLHDRFAEVVGLDPNAEMLLEARSAAVAANAANLRWLQMPAEQIGPALGRFRLATAGSSFHWMDRPLLLRRLYDLLEDDGGVAICGTNSFGAAERPWEQLVAETVQRWQNSEWRALVDARHQRGRHEECLPDSPFRRWELGEVRWQRVVDVDEIVGELFSMSYFNRASLGERAEPFAAELRAALLALEPSDRFEQELLADYILAWKH